MRDLNTIFGVATYKTHGAQITARTSTQQIGVVLFGHSAAEVDEKVSAWLARHPEATLVSRRDAQAS